MFIFRPIIIVLIINQIFTFFRCFALYVNEKNVDKVVLGMSHFYDFSRKMCHITKFLWEVKYEEGKSLFLKVVMAILVVGTLPSLSGLQAVHAEGPNDPAPEIKPVNDNGKKVLFDNTHGQTAGAADWVIDGGFSDFGNAIAKKVTM